MLILNLETSGLNCSVTLNRGEDCLAHVGQISDKFIHSEKLHVFIDQCLKEAEVAPQDLDAIAISQGPGSYTGLRIGTSAAKGLCYALKIPLIAHDTCRIIEAQMRYQADSEFEFYVPIIDARRMEVYSSIFDFQGTEIQAVSPMIWDENILHDYREKKVLFGGDACAKCSIASPSQTWEYQEGVFPDSKYMAKLSVEKYESGEFEDVAYFEPFYLKAFVAGKPKNLLRPKKS